MADTGWAVYVLQRLAQIYVIKAILFLNKTNLNTNYFLKFENMKMESRVIVDDYATVNMYCNLVLTARHVSGVNFIKVMVTNLLK